MRIAYWCFLLFVFLKQFYIFESGGIQLGDFFLLISFTVFIYIHKGVKEITYNKIDRLLFYFILSVIIINTFYFALNQRFEYMISTLHYIFNFVVVILFRFYSKDTRFLDKVFLVCKLNLLVQLAIFLMGIGKFYLTIRYMGTFNDPNQMAFFVYMTLMLLFIISKILDKKISIIYYFISIFLIFQTASTGMFIAIFSFIILLVISNLFSVIRKSNFKFKNFFVMGTLCMVLFLLFYSNVMNFKDNISESFIIQRVEEKFSRQSSEVLNPTSSSEMSNSQDRGIDKLFIYPERLILGAGQGNYARFNEAAHIGEIHSTILSILFYYGIFPTFILLIWFKKNITKINWLTLVLYIPLLIESFTLLNQRQPFFWMLFVLTYIYFSNYEQSIEKRKFKSLESEKC